MLTEHHTSLGESQLYISDDGFRTLNIPDLIFKSIHFFLSAELVLPYMRFFFQIVVLYIQATWITFIMKISESSRHNMQHITEVLALKPNS